MAEWMEDNHVLAEISKSSRNPFLPSSNRFPIPSEIQEDGLSGKKPKIWSWYKQVYRPEQHTNVTKGNLYTMEWFLITCHNSKPIGTRGLYCDEHACFFRGLGWNGDGGGGWERTSPPRLICRGTDELTRDRGTGDVDTQGHFTLPPSHVVL